jgi:uncharacterized protein
MNTVFAETSFYVALLAERDAHHADAVAFYDSFPGRYVTTEFVLLEVATFFTRQAGRERFCELVEELRSSKLVTVIPATAELFDGGYRLFAARPDKEWSLTDCISFQVMTDHGLTDALTADHHFAQAGFAPLLA